MWGSATLAMEVSNTSMKAASATVAAIRHKVDINTLDKLEAADLQMNEIGGVLRSEHQWCERDDRKVG